MKTKPSSSRWTRRREKRKNKQNVEIIICSVTNLLCIQIKVRELNTFFCVCVFNSNWNNKIQRHWTPLSQVYGLVLMAKWIEKSDEEKAIAYQNQIVSEKVTT